MQYKKLTIGEIMQICKEQGIVDLAQENQFLNLKETLMATHEIDHREASHMATVIIEVGRIINTINIRAKLYTQFDPNQE